MSVSESSTNPLQAASRPSGNDSTGARRMWFGTLVALTMLAMTGLMMLTLSRGGFDPIELALISCFLITLPWMAVGFWNAVIGLIIMRASSDPAQAVYPHAAGPAEDDPITQSTAILMCIRNEDAVKVARNLGVMIEGLVDTGWSKRFHVYILSDSSWDDSVETERRTFARLRGRWQGIVPVTYRLREDNTGFKAGNIDDFCRRWGDRHDFALVLDADSLMSGASILRMVRTMQRNERLGILQSLVVGMPTVSTFARIFQFGMRLGMRSYTLGSAWWQADCGPYWGHNALVRLKPFIEHCRLPVLPGGPPLGGEILSHDQVEAVLMRRAGYEVRVLPEEGGSWEENPPTLVEYIRRDLRWCQGNMQYFRLLAMPGLRPVSRIQLALAILMYLGSPAWVVFMTLSAAGAGLAADPSEMFHAEVGLVLFACIMTMVFAPKLATVIEVLASPRARRAFGGSSSILLSTLGEAIVSALLAPVLALAHTRFLLGLPFGRATVWSAQRRSTHEVSFREALKRLWPQTLFGASLVTWLLLAAPFALLGFLPFLLGTLLAIPLAMLSSWRGPGFLLATRGGLWRTPDDTAPAAELLALRLPALYRSRRTLATARPALVGASGE